MGIKGLKDRLDETTFKSLKYGHDRPGGGDSGQPYIATDFEGNSSVSVNPNSIITSLKTKSIDIPNLSARLNGSKVGSFALQALNTDDFIRGGAVGSAQAAINDTFRIGAFLTSKPKGPLFIAKQVALQFSNPKLETKKGVGGFFSNLLAGDIGVVQPTRLYNLGVNTLAQVSANALGIHFSRHGLFPVQDDSTKYLAIAKYNNEDTAYDGAGLPKKSTNRLVRYAYKLLPDAPPSNTRASNLFRNIGKFIPGVSLFLAPGPERVIDSYLGGPGSVYGVGKTFIRRYDYTSNGINKQPAQAKGVINYDGLRGVSKLYAESDKPAMQRFTQFSGVERDNPYSGGEFKLTSLNSGFSQGIIGNNILDLPTTDQNVIPYEQNVPYGANGTSNSPTFRKYAKLRQQIDDQRTKSGATIIIPDNNGGTTTYSNVNKFGIYDTDLPASNYYNVNNDLTNKILLPSSPDNPEYYNGTDIVTIKTPWNKINRDISVGSGRKDTINKTPLFFSNTDPGASVNINGKDYTINDFVNFRIQALDGDNPTNDSAWMIFRAYLTQFSDNTDATWSEIKYAGRGEKFYIYDGFSRKIQIGFKVAALSAEEMEPMYQKLNFLMGNVMPDYKDGLLMRGPMVKMTVGNWLYGQDGILNSVSYTIPNDSPWEIGISDNNTSGSLVLPHIVEVSMTFTPIGSQTQDINVISQKGNSTIMPSNIAQNKANGYQYI